MFAVLAFSDAARAEFPFPACMGPTCTDPSDFQSYLFLAPGVLPDDFTGGETWKYADETGMNVVGAWQETTGRPDVFGAILDSGIRWSDARVAKAAWLNAGELPLPPGCAQQDCNGDGFVSVADYAGVPDGNGNGVLDPEDLILAYSDGVDGDGNGFVDDICGWDFYDDDNDPFDDVDYGHGTGEAEDQVSEANDGSGFPGVAPSTRFVPLRVNDSFIAMGSEFSQAVVYATDLGADLISEALGTLTAGRVDQAAIDYAYEHGVPIVASAADEESLHHNFPAALGHTIWVNSIRNGDGTIVEETDQYDILNGCTNYGGHAWVAISSTSCSSEATGRGAGLVRLLLSHGRNQMDRGLLQPYPGTDRPFSAEEVRQLLRRSAVDIDQSANLTLTMNTLLQGLLSGPAGSDIEFGSSNFPTAPGWDQFTGYGRPDAVSLLDVADATMPPEADLSGSLDWFATVDPARTKKVPVVGSAAATRAPGGKFKWRLEVGCGVDPREFRKLKQGKGKTRIDHQTLAQWKPATTAKQCGFDPAQPIENSDAHTVTLRLVVEDKAGYLGEDRRTVAIHTDPTLKFAPKALGASAESPIKVADIDGDGVLDIVVASSDGAVHALRGATGEELPGFPARTNSLPVHLTAGFLTGAVPVPREAILSPIAVGDLDGDGHPEIVAASTEGRVYVFQHDGSRRPGFPVSTNPAFSRPADRDSLNDADRGVIAGATLGDLDDPPDGQLEIVISGLDGFLYVWDANGSPRDGFPVRIADTSKVSIDPMTGKATAVAMDVQERGRKLLGSPAIGDLDGDGSPEIIVTSNEEYGGEPDGFAPDPNSALTDLLLHLPPGIDLGDFALDVQGRIYAVHADGNLHGGGPFRPGWPVKVPIVAPGLLPTVGTGTPGAPALAKLDDGTNELTVAIFGIAGPVLLIAPDGSSRLGVTDGAPNVLATDFPDGFPNVPDTAGASDAPFFGALGAGAFGDLDGDGKPEYVAPVGGVHKLLDVAAPGSQHFGAHEIAAWNPRDGSLLPAFPRLMDDMMFLTSPAIADVDGDGHAEIIQGSGGYLLRAYASDGATPTGWPKFTHGWLVSSATPADVDGDGQLEIVAATREGNLYVWDTPSPATAGSVQWQGFGADNQNTQNWSAHLAVPAAPSD